jgi:hypothetical protein
VGQRHPQSQRLWKGRELERRVEDGLAGEGNLDERAVSDGERRRREAEQPWYPRLVPVGSVASSVMSSRGFTARTAMMLCACVSDVSRVLLVPGGPAVRLLGDQEQPGAVPARAAGRREPKVEALAADREQVGHHAGDGLRRGVAVVGRLDDLRVDAQRRLVGGHPPVDAGEIDPALRS